MIASHRLLALPVAVLLTGLALAGCAAPVAGAPSSSPAAGGGEEQEIDAAWLDDGRMIGLVTQGSSGCVPTAEDATLDGSVLTVTLVGPDADTACTADYGPRVSLVVLPAGVDPTQDLEIRVTGDGWRGDTDLDGVPGLTAGGTTDYAPSAGWTDADGQFVILTWGSSTCAPMVETVTLSGPSEVTVLFATPPTDQVCTMDLAPRAVLAVAEGLADDAETFAVLTGAEFDNVRIPIVGEH
ncbi:hypothetical protein NQ152_15660 [Microbacterium sp. zg.B48]|uniref:hypothetical protein n=1 Tax=Microbacterium sp. zg.B48 TaxID=2969408 RepID=UPI00214AF506|nr:hypothetical protein [Microbacterium sp. zg.B48]MCR2764944.1 hypothetical protein [Microbacterium sp. zg.B48]